MAWAGALLGAGCGGGSETGGNGDGSGCASWQIDFSDGRHGTAELADGALVLRASGLPARWDQSAPFGGNEIAFKQAGLTGNFDVTITWEDFRTGGGIWSRVQGGVWSTDPSSGYVVQATGSLSGAAAEAMVLNFPTDGVIEGVYGTPVTLDHASGSFHIVRTAAGATVTTTAIGMTATSQSTVPFPAGSYTLFLGIGYAPVTSDTDQHADESIRITGVTVSGGGGTVKSDDFSCGTLDLAAGTLTPS